MFGPVRGAGSLKKLVEPLCKASLEAGAEDRFYPRMFKNANLFHKGGKVVKICAPLSSRILT